MVTGPFEIVHNFYTVMLQTAVAVKIVACGCSAKPAKNTSSGPNLWTLSLAQRSVSRLIISKRVKNRLKMIELLSREQKEN